MLIEIKEQKQNIKVGDLVKTPDGVLKFVARDGNDFFLISLNNFNVTSLRCGNIDKLIKSYELTLAAKNEDLKLTLNKYEVI